MSQGYLHVRYFVFTPSTGKPIDNTVKSWAAVGWGQKPKPKNEKIKKNLEKIKLCTFNFKIKNPNLVEFSLENVHN